MSNNSQADTTSTRPQMGDEELRSVTDAIYAVMDRNAADLTYEGAELFAKTALAALSRVSPMGKSDAQGLPLESADDPTPFPNHDIEITERGVRCISCRRSGIVLADPCPSPVATDSQELRDEDQSEPRCLFCGRDPFHRVDNGVGMIAVAVNCCELGCAAYGKSDEVTISRDDFNSIIEKLVMSRVRASLPQPTAQSTGELENLSFDESTVEDAAPFSRETVGIPATISDENGDIICHLNVEGSEEEIQRREAIMKALIAVVRGAGR